MPQLLFQQRSSSRSGGGYRARDASPDSVIFTLESNFSLFSSASASVDRCSFASDAHDRDSLASEISLHLAGHGIASGVGNDALHETSGGPDQDPDPNPNSNKQAPAQSRLFKKVEKAIGQKEDDNKASTIEQLADDNSHLIDSARSSFSLALKECQERRSRSETVSRKPDRRRPASLDLHNVIAAAGSSSSPRLSAMKKSTPSSKKLGTFPSPGTPNYRQVSVGMQKGWSSERVPSHRGHNNNRRHQVNSNALLLPFNTNGRTLPSKWEDAERWIFSPVSGDGGIRTSIQRRPKSKSGPLGPPGNAYYSLCSPAMPVFDGGNVGNFVGGSSPFSAGVIAAGGLGPFVIGSNDNTNVGFHARAEPCMARSVSVHGCSDVLAQSLSTAQDEKLDGVKDGATDLFSVSRRDMATQMSPEGSSHSSPSLRRPSFSASTPCTNLPLVEVQTVHSSISEVRDVEVDERVTVTRWSKKKHKSRNQRKNSEIVDDWRKKCVDARSSAWDVSEAAKSISKAQREEAKITAWENLQKAKAEAAIRKLEMKLEKKRSSSMDKIMNKLKSAQKKAQRMRSSISTNQAQEFSRTPHKAISFCRTRQMGSLSGCFTCHAF